MLDGPPRDLADHAPGVPAALTTLVARAMARDPAARLTAAELARELKRFQTGQLVASHRYTPRELVVRWLRRHRAAAAVAVIAVIVLAVSGWKLLDERGRADRAAALARARADAATLAHAREALDADPTAALAALAQLSPGATEQRAARMVAADAWSRGVARELTAGDGAAVHLLAYAPAGDALLAADDRLQLRRWDLATGTARTQPTTAHVLALSAAVPGAVVWADADGAVRRWDLATDAVTTLRELGEVNRVALSADARTAAVFLSGAATRIVDLASGATTELASFAAGQWTADGALVVHDRPGARLLRWDPRTGELAPLGAVRGVILALAADADHAWWGSHTGELGEARAPRWTAALGAPITALAVMSDGRVASTSSALALRPTTDQLEPVTGDAAIAIREVARAAVLAPALRLRGHAAPVAALAAGPDGALASADHRGAIRLWRPPLPTRTTDDARTIQAAARAPGGALLLARRGPLLEVAGARSELAAFPPGFDRSTRAIERSTRMIELAGRRITEVTPGPDDAITTLVASASGAQLASLDDQRHAIAWDLTTRRGRLLATDATHVAISGDGRRVAVATADHQLRELDAATGTARVLATGPVPTALAWSPDGRTLAVGTLDHRILFLDRAGGGVRALAVGRDVIRVLAWSTDGATAIGGGDDWVVRRWTAATGAALPLLAGHAGTITRLVPTADGRIASAAADASIRVWPATAGPPRVLAAQAAVRSLVFAAPDLLIAGGDDHARVWDLATGLGRALPAHPAPVVFADRPAGGSAIVVVDQLGQVIAYPDAAPARPR